MVIYELDFSTTRFAIDHASPCRDAHNDLLVQRTANRASRKFGDECIGRSKDTALGTTNILPIDEEIGVPLRQFCQCLINSTQHGGLSHLPSWRILLPLW